MPAKCCGIVCSINGGCRSIRSCVVLKRGYYRPQRVLDHGRKSTSSVTSFEGLAILEGIAYGYPTLVATYSPRGFMK